MKNTKTVLLSLALLSAWVFSPTSVLAAETVTAAKTPAITIENPMIRLAPPASPNSGGFMLLKNSSATDVNLIKAESDISKVVELHEMVMDQGTMKMRPVGKILIPAKGQTALAPGGLHVMFIGLTAALKDGESKSVTLHFDNGQVEKIEAPVKAITPPHMGMGKGQGMGMMGGQGMKKGKGPGKGAGPGPGANGSGQGAW